MSPRTKKPRRFNPDRDVKEWKGAYVPYDILKEAFVAFLAVAVLIVLLAVVFSSPDEPAITLKTWSAVDPVDFAQTAITELDGTQRNRHLRAARTTRRPTRRSTSASSSPPSGSASTSPSTPRRTSSSARCGPCPTSRVTQAALNVYQSASPAQQSAWTTAYEKAVANATDVNGRLHVPAGRYGPVGVIIGSLTAMAQTGGLDGTLLSEGQFYNTNYTKPLLFLADGTYLANLAGAQHLQGTQWGMMNETGNYPGQAWLWLYTMWYQVSPDEPVDQRRPRGVGHHDGALRRVDLPAVHPGPALHPPLDPGLQADLATPLPRAGRSHLIRRFL